MVLTLMLTATLFWPKKPLPLTPPLKPAPHAQWYMAERGGAVKCTGKPHVVLTPKGLRRAVEGCGLELQILLRD